MGALETLYTLVYGKTPDSGGGADLLGAPDRLKMYAIQKLLQGNQAISDYHDWMNDLDIEARGREGKSFDEDYLDEDTRKRIAYARQKMAERKAASVAGAEKSGEVAQKRGGSPYRSAEVIPDSIARPSFDQIPVGGRKPTESPSDGFSDTDFGSLMRRYVSDAERDYGWEEQAAEDLRLSREPKIEVPGGYDSLQLIARQAIAKGRGGGELVFGDPDAEQHYLMGGRKAEWPYEVSRQYPDTAGVSVPGGTFSQMGRTLTGGDSPEDLRRYADEVRRNQTAIKIATIEASAPAKYRSPATNEYLKMLYEQKADEERAGVDAMQAAAAIRNADANITQSNAYAEYYGGRNAAETEQESIKALADIEIEKIKTKGDLLEQFGDLLATLGGDPLKGGNPQLYVQVLKTVGMAATPQQAYDDVIKLLGGVPSGAGKEKDILDVAMRGLE